MRLILFTLMIVTAPARAATRVVIDVDLTRQTVRIDKYDGRKRPLTVRDVSLRVVAGSVKPGVYRPRLGRARGLEHAVFFAGSRAIRSSAHFAAMRASGRPVAGSVVVSPEFGGLLYATLAKAGVRGAVVRVHD